MNKITDMNSLLKTWEDLFTRARSDIDALQATVEILKEELETERQISSSLALRCEMISYAITSIQGKLGHPWMKPNTSNTSEESVRARQQQQQPRPTESSLLR